MSDDSRTPIIVLASGSPRRKELLQRLRVPFAVDPGSIVERPPNPGENPAGYALALARYKASEGALRHPDVLVVGADTVVTIAGFILGKPRNEEHAVQMLRLLRGQRHEVITAVSVRKGPTGQSDVVTSGVTMMWASDEELRGYVLTGEPMDKAGGYAVQGLGGQFVDGVSGCFNNVVGLPLCLTACLMVECGIEVQVPEGADPHTPPALPHGGVS